ncbi:uncharacterized, partial [Tachysurus ichikawai]
TQPDDIAPSPPSADVYLLALIHCRGCIWEFFRNLAAADKDSWVCSFVLFSKDSEAAGFILPVCSPAPLCLLTWK